MDYKRANRAYLYVVITTLLLVLVMSLWNVIVGLDISVLASNVFSELAVLLPVLATVLFSGDRLGVVIPLRKIKVSSVLFTILYVILLFPLVTFVNSLSMLFVDNTVAGLSDEILRYPMWTMLLSIGIISPFIEEIVFRGVLLHSYQRTGRIIASIILSSVLFGMIHMNFNQFAYGAVMGAMFAILVEATGSVISSFIAHACFNSIEVLMMYASSDALDSAEEYLVKFDLSENIILMLVIYLVLAVIFTTIAMFAVRHIAVIEGRIEFFKSITGRPRVKGVHLVTIPLVIGMIISILYMILVEYMLHAL